MSLKDLPISPELCGDVVVRTYNAELSVVQDEEALKAFVLRWSSLYGLKLEEPSREMPRKERETVKTVKSLIDGTFNPNLAMSCLRLIRKGRDCGHGRGGSCAAMLISVPTALLRAHYISKEFGVPADVALIQDNTDFPREDESAGVPDEVS